jgi:hypothetical protein
LQKAITFLEEVEKEEDLSYARQLLQQAEQGQAAAALVRQTRQALQEKNYRQTIDLAKEATTTYLSLDDTRRLEEIDAYRQWATEVLALRRELTGWQERIEASPDVSDAGVAQIKQLRQELGILGDTESVAIAEQLLNAISNHRWQQAQHTATIGGLVAIGLVLFWWMLRWWRRPDETRLI